MPFDVETIAQRFRRLLPDGLDHASLRVVEEHSQTTRVRQDVVEPAGRSIDRGAMVAVLAGNGIGYAATSDLSDAGLRAAIGRAAQWARLSAGRSVFDAAPRLPKASGRYASITTRPLRLNAADRIELLLRESKACRIDERIVDWEASLWTVRSRQLTAGSDGGETLQEFDFTIPALHVVAHADGLTQTRSWGGRYNGYCQQGGLEVIERSGFVGCGRATAEEALQLLAAPNCPSGRFDVLLMPDQMMLQIHESIGHPLELDRILGDERNYAGTSFVTPDMFGSYRYGSRLLNITFDPGVTQEMASYSFDDEGTPAERTYLIREGILLRPLGGSTSQVRAGMPGVANARASSWNRPAIDRMANLNLEPGESSFDELVGSIESGVLMDANRSWSIDDSRNKFQFGCELGRLIRDGELGGLVRNPNYRGISATFWRNLAAVGDARSFEVWGTPNCGKGEPNQMIHVGHASPACVFRNVEVFGGA